MIFGPRPAPPALQQLAVGPACRAPVRDQPQLGLVVESDRLFAPGRSPIPTAGRRSERGNAFKPFRGGEGHRPVQCRWLINTTSHIARVQARHSGAPGRSACPRTEHRPIVLLVDPLADAGLDQHAAGRGLDERAVERPDRSRRFGVELPLGPVPPSITGPAGICRRVPSGTCRPRTSATVVPLPRSTPRQSTASLTPSPSPPRGAAKPRSRSRRGRLSRRFGLATGARTRAPCSSVRPLHRRAHPEEADLADPHPGVEGDRQVGDVGQLEVNSPFQPGSAVAGRQSG